MPRMSEADRRELAALRAICAEDPGRTDLAARVAPRLARHVEADGYCFLVIDPETMLPIEALATRGQTAVGDALRERLLDGWQFTEAKTVADRLPRAFHLEGFAGDERPPCLYLRESLRELGFERDAQVSFAAQGRVWGHLDLHRTGGAPPFDPRHLRFLDAAAPPVTEALRRGAAAALLAAAAGAESGVVTLDGEGRIEAMSGPSRRLLAEADGEGGVFPLALAAICGVVRRALGGDERLSPESLLVVREAERWRLQGHLLEGLDGRERGAVAIEPLRSLDDVGSLRRAGLTPREAEVTRATLRGFTSGRVAELLELSVHTVEHHLRNVFEKLGVGSRGELAALLLAGGGAAEALG